MDLAFGDSGPRLSIRSAALGALGLLSRQRPVSTRACIVAKCTPFEVKLAELFQEHDQLFKDNLCAFLTGAIVGHLRLGLYDDLRSLLDVPAVMSRMIAIFEDPASMPGRPLCAALPDLINSFSGTSSPELHKCAEGVMAALLRTKPDRYWRVQVDVAKALGSVGYRSFCAAVPLQMSRSMQAQSLEFVLSLLGSRDSKVQTGAAEALVCMAGLLCTDPSEAALLLPRTDIWPTHSVASAGRGVEVVVQSLVQKTLQPNPRSQQKGVYRALRMLFARFARLLSGPENSPNPLGAYAVELMPLLLERLAGSVFSLDLECHVDMLALVGLLARGNRAYFGAYAEQALAHCLRLMDMITRITETKEPPPPSKDFSLGVEYISLLKGVAGLVGAYEKTAGYQKIYSKLYNTYMTTSGGGGSSSSNSNGLDKFSEMRPLVIRTVASVVGCMGPDALLKYKDELMYYLSLLYHHEPSSVLGCVGELFQALFTDELPATKLSLPRDREGLFATWGNLCSTETGRVPNANASKQALVTDFELFVRTAMKTYGTSTSGECKAAVLRFVTTLVKCGVNKNKCCSLVVHFTFACCLFQRLHTTSSIRRVSLWRL